MKLLIFSDIQFHNWREFSRILPNGRNSRFQNQLDALHEVLDAAVRYECDMMVHDGDLFESRADSIDKQVFLTVFEEFKNFSKEGIPVVLNVGNHDMIDRTETSHILQPFKEISNVIVVDKPKSEIVSDCRFAFIPYTRYDFKDKVLKLSSGSGNSYLFTHQGVGGAKTGPRDINIKEEFHVEDFKWRNFTAVFNGHYHKAQKLTPSFYIIGSTIQKDFGERGEWKGYRLLDTNTGVVNSIEIESSPRFFKYDGVLWSGARISLTELNKVYDEVRPQDFVWIHSDAPVDERAIRAGFKTPNIRITVESQRKEIKPRSELNISMDTKTQFNLYIQAQKTKLDKEKLLNLGMDVYSRSL